MTDFNRRSRVVAMGGASLIALAVCSGAHAQQAPASGGKATTEVGEVVVTGYRASLQTALTNKRNSILPIESVAPEDIGKLPDQNVAESLQRLAGIQIDRTQGQGTTVLIDGLRQNLTTLNGDIFLTGKEIGVSGENSGGGSGAGNQYDSLESIPSEEISGIDVYKNPKASMTEGGLGGTIDLKLRDPLSGPDGWSVGGNLRGTTSDGTNSWTPIGAIVAGYKVNDRLGVTGSISYDDEKTHTKEFQDQNRSAWVITNSATAANPGNGTNATPATLPGGQYYIDPQLAYFTDQYDERKTLGASLGVAFEVTNAWTTHLNWFYSRDDDVQTSFSDKVWFNGQGDKAGQTTTMPGIAAAAPYAIDGNGVVQNATFNANGAETASNYFHTISEANNFQWINKFDPGGPLKGDFDVFYSRATSNFQADQADVEHGLYNTAGGVATSPGAPGCNNGADTCNGGNPGYQFTWSNGGTSGLPSVSYPTNILSNPADTTFKSNWAWANFTTLKNWSIKGDLSYKADFIPVETMFSGGFRVANRDINQVFGRYLINGDLPTGQVAGPVGPNQGPWIYYQDPGYSNGNNINVPYSTATSNPGLVKSVNNFGAGPILVKNPAAMSNPSTYLNTIWSGAGVPNNTETFFKDGLSSFEVKENTYAGYAMGDIGGPADRFHINFGVRVVDTHLVIDNGQSAQNPTYYGTASWNGVDSNVVGVQTTRNYIDILPSFNFVLDLTDQQKVRVDAARVMSPQDLFSLGLGNSYGFTRSGGGNTFVFNGGSSGNTKLDPYRANQFDASWEDYFTRGGLISVAGFYKAIDSFVETQNVATTIGGTTANVSEPVNGGAGSIYGAELEFQYAFDGDWLWSGLKGFGVAANYTRSESFSEQPTAFSAQGPIPGVAKNAITATGYYERNGFSARLSYSWRDKSVNDSPVGSTFAFNNQNGVSKVYTVYQAPYGQLDGQIGYDFTKQLGVIFSVQNITGSYQHTYLQWPNLPFTYDNWGRRYYAGVKFKF